MMDGAVAILGGSGFVGRFLMERGPAGGRQPLRFLIHRSHPSWLEDRGADVRLVDLADPQGLREALDGATCLINLLRPDGRLWLKRVMQQLVPVLAKTSVSRLIHTSSIDVYGETRAQYVTEDTKPEPRTRYQKEHFEIEQIVESAPFETCIVRPGAIFGPGGRNLVTFVPEMRDGLLWKLAGRRALYGQRRMHLVSVENVADAIHSLALSSSGDLPSRLLVTDDIAPENNFAFVQEVMAKVFGRTSLDWVPQIPHFALRAALFARSQGNGDPRRRFSNDKLVETRFQPERPFPARLLQYVTFLRDISELPA